jgi:hypothetical protein
VTAHGEILVSTRAAHVVDEEKVMGTEFWEAVAWRTGEPLGWHQVIATHEMPHLLLGGGGPCPPAPVAFGSVALS